MGINCELNIGTKNWSWKNYIPDVIALLFTPEDYRYIHHADEGWGEHKFVCTCGKVASQLSSFGISLDVLKKLHFHYFGFNFKDYTDDLFHRCSSYLQRKYGDDIDDSQIEKMTNKLIAWYFIEINKEEEFGKVLQLNKSSQASKEKTESLFKRSSPDEIDWILFYRGLLTEFLNKDPYTYRLADEFRDLTTDSEDLDLIYAIGLVVFTNNKKTVIEFDFSEFTDSDGNMSDQEVIGLLNELRYSFQEKYKWIISIFGQIHFDLTASTTFEPLERTNFRTHKEKGEYLEELVTNLFTTQTGFTVKKNVRRKSEEIDLMILNRLEDPFWVSLQSPVILAECKNQNNKVEPKDVRNFEIKIQDRKSLCRLGIMISTSGFTKGCYETTARSGRDGYKILLIDSKELQKRRINGLKTSEWLEQLILEQC